MLFSSIPTTLPAPFRSTCSIPRTANLTGWWCRMPSAASSSSTPDAFAVSGRMEDIFRNSSYALIEPTVALEAPTPRTDAYRATILRKHECHVHFPAVFESEIKSAPLLARSHSRYLPALPCPREAHAG